MSNLLVGYACERIGVKSWRMKLSQGIGTFNDESARESWETGRAIANGTNAWTAVTNLVNGIWGSADPKNRKLWPNRNEATNFVPPDRFSDPDTEFTCPGFIYMDNP